MLDFIFYRYKQKQSKVSSWPMRIHHFLGRWKTVKLVNRDLSREFLSPSPSFSHLLVSFIFVCFVRNFPYLLFFPSLFVRFVTIEVNGDAEENQNPKALPEDG